MLVLVACAMLACTGRRGSKFESQMPPPPPPQVLPLVSAQFVEISSLPQRAIVMAAQPPVVSMHPASMPRMSGLTRVCVVDDNFSALVRANACVFACLCARVRQPPQAFPFQHPSTLLKVSWKWSRGRERGELVAKRMHRGQNRQRRKIMEICPDCSGMCMRKGVCGVGTKP